MEIKVKSLFGVTETATINNVKSHQLEKIEVGGFAHYTFNGHVLLTIDLEQQHIIYADKAVTVYHNFQGKVQRFQGISELQL